MTKRKMILNGVALMAVVLPNLASAQSGRLDRIDRGRIDREFDRRPDLDERPDRIDRSQVIRLSTALVQNVRQTERLAARESVSYRPSELRVLQLLRSLSQRSDELALAARNQRPGGAQRLRVLMSEVEAIADRAGIALVRANLSYRVDRSFEDVRMVARRLASEIRMLRPMPIRGGR